MSSIHVASASRSVGDLRVTPVEVNHLPRVLLFVPNPGLLRLAGVCTLVPTLKKDQIKMTKGPIGHITFNIIPVNVLDDEDVRDACSVVIEDVHVRI